MTLCEFFELYEEAPVAQAFNTLRKHLNRHFDELPPFAYSPWTLKLGKGGPKPDGGYYDSAEQSLYRHCMDVAVLAAWFFYHAWQERRPPFTVDTDPVAVLSTLFAIAFAHDADKLLDGISKSPMLEEVQALYEQLAMDAWSGLTITQLHHAVSRVENRGLGQALFGGGRIDPLTEKLAELVHEGDNLLSRVARAGGTAQAFIDIFNHDLPRLYSLYGVPDQPLRLIRFRHQPIVLHRLQDFLGKWFFESDFYPLIYVRRGEWLEISTIEDMDFGPWLDRFETQLSDSQPSLKVAPTTGTITWFHVSGADDLIKAVLNDPKQALLLLRVTAKDWETVAPLVKFWVMQAGAPFSTTPRKGNLCMVFKTSGEIPDTHPFWGAASLAATMPDRAAVECLLETEQASSVCKSLQQNGIKFENLDSLSLRTVVALKTSLLVDRESLIQWLDRIQGAWPKQRNTDPGARAIVQSLKSQLGLPDPETTALPYTQPPKGGTCLVCGAPTAQVIESSRMKLAGVKASSFSNRIGHAKYLQSEKGDNYVCPTCLRIQGLLLDTVPNLRSTPMLIATPVRHLLDTRTNDRQKNLFRSFDAVSKNNWRLVLPWQSDACYDEPLLFEERPTALAEVIDQMYRLACYTALSGEPVHAFIAGQRECKAAFLYENTPELLKGLLADLTGDEGGISRKYLKKLIDRLQLFKTMLAEYEGMAGIQALPRFGWWAVAFVLLRALSRAAEKDKKKIVNRFHDFIEPARQEYPMKQYDEWLDVLVREATETQPIKGDPSGAEWTLMLRIALEIFQKHYAFGPGPTRDAIAQRLRADLSRRYRNLYQKGLDDHLHAFTKAAYDLLEKADQEFDLESGFTRFLFAAYEGGLRRRVQTRWKNRETSPETAVPLEPSD